MSPKILQRRTFFALVLVFNLPPALAQSAGEPLTLDQAVHAALARQPQIEAQQAAIREAREAAVADAQLPDPRLSFGISDLTVTGADAYTLRRESDTQIVAGISQEFPRGDTRRLRGERGERIAELRSAELDRLRREIERETTLAWIDVWKPERARELAEAAAREAALQSQAVEIAYRAGKATQAEWLAARVALEALNDQVAASEQTAAHARNQLSRWIGEDAFRPLSADLSQHPPKPLGDLLTQLSNHPHLNAVAQQVAVARSEVALAEQDYKPGWNVEVDYGYRPEFSDYATVKVGMDLPFFTGNRQDRQLAAKLAELDRVQALAADNLRMHRADLRLNFQDWTLLKQRIERYDQTILPQAQTRIEAAQLGWQSGAGTLAQVLDARRAALDLRLQRLDLQADNARHLAQLHYFDFEGDPHAQ